MIKKGLKRESSNEPQTKEQKKLMEKRVGDIMKRVFMINSEQAKIYAIQALKAISDYTKPLQMILQPETRKLSQNAAQWPILNAFSEQIKWPFYGDMVYLSDYEWKDILTAAFKKEIPKIVPSFDGKGFIMLGYKTREFTCEEWPAWMEFLNWAASEKGVKIPVSKKEAEAWGINE